MKKLLVIAATGAAVVFSSCKKDNKGSDPGGGGGATRLIKKMTKIDAGDTTVYNFTYDQARQLQGFSNASGDEATTFTYDAAGNLSGATFIQAGAKSTYTYEWSNNRPVSGKLQSWYVNGGEPDELLESDNLTYTLTGDQVTKIHVDMTLSNLSIDFNLSYTDGNLSKVQSTQGLDYTATFVFGTRKSPFPKLTKYLLDKDGVSLVFGSSHELITSSYDFAGTQFDYSTTQQYTYDAAGYPLTADDGETKYIYEYQ